MAQEVKARARALFERVFPERQIYHRSGGSVRYVSVSPWQQALFASGATLVVGWCVFASANVLLRGPTMNFQSEAAERKIASYERWLQQSKAKEAAALSLLEEKTIAFNNATNEFEHRHETLKNLLRSLKGEQINDELALKGNGGGVLVNSTIEEADSRQNRASPAVTASVEVAGFRAQINKLRADQASFLDEAETRAVEDADRYKGVLRLTGVGVGRVVEQADTQVGGPLVEITPASDISDPALTADEIEFKNRVREVKARLDEAEMLEDLVHAMPLGVPVGSDFRFTSGFGKRVDPVRGGLALHLGLDMAAFRNAPITAPAPGTVVFSGRNGAYGLCVEIDHGYGFRTRYGHLAKLSVKKGDVVTLGQKLGGMGTTGRSTGVHLHYEVYFRGKTYDPRKFLRAGKHVYEG